MTKNHFIQVAKTLNEYYRGDPAIYNHGYKFESFNELIKELCVTFKEINSDFNKKRFMDAVYK